VFSWSVKGPGFEPQFFTCYTTFRSGVCELQAVSQ